MKTKLFILLFALVAASIGTMSAAITVRLDPSSCTSWSTVRLWAWTDNGNIFDSWPGQIVSLDSDGWYSYTFDASITSVNIIWNNGKDQTIDITNVSVSTCFALIEQTGKPGVNTVDCTTGQYLSTTGNHVPIGDLYYNLSTSGNTAEVTYGNYKFSSVTIPSSVIYNGVSYTVTSIKNDAFSECFSLTSITIPNSVTSIGEYAFYKCSFLTSITIPNSVTSIGKFAFYGCSSLTSPVYNAHCFAYMPISYSGAYTIPEGIKQIAGSAFYGCKSLTSVTIPNSVTSIGGYAFCHCYSLSSVTIPNSVTSIGGSAFSYCSSLTSITIPNSVTSIGEDAFYYCYSLTSITIPNSVTSIGERAFRDCSGLTSIDIPNSVTSIGKEAFYGCSGLTSVTIEAETPPALGSYAFNNTNNCPIYVPCGTLDAYKTAWSEYASQIKYEPLKYHITGNVNNEAAGNVQIPQNKCEDVIAIPNYGYHFTQWSDGNTDNPRTIILASDTTFTAEFAHNPIITYVYNSQMGTVSGPTITTTGVAVEYITFNATPNYGCHFVQWSDGLKDNPRIAQITQDTTFTAEFAYDRVGTCGKDLALVWSYDPNAKVLTIGNAGEFTENMQFGVEAPGEMEELVIGNSVTAIGENAFANISTLKKVTIGESVKTIHNNAFYNCVNLETIFNYRPTPTNAYSTAFDGVDKFACSLYVLPSSIDMYKNASVWRDFYYTYAIGAEEATVTTNNVTVEPQDNAATVTWPTSENAATYTIEITKDGEVFCTLIFKGNGQLTGIAFAPSRDGQAHAPAAIMTANGLQFTVTGLNSATHYALTLQAKDDQNTVLASYSSEFTTTGTATAVDNVQGNEVQSTKVLRNGQIFILRNGKTYTMQGQEVK